MSFLKKVDRHSALVGRMAETLGADVVGAAMNGAVPETVLRSAVYNCMRCDAPEACEHWLEDHAEGAEVAPDYCRNKALLERLKGEQV